MDVIHIINDANAGNLHEDVAQGRRDPARWFQSSVNTMTLILCCRNISLSQSHMSLYAGLRGWLKLPRRVLAKISDEPNQNTVPAVTRTCHILQFLSSSSSFFFSNLLWVSAPFKDLRTFISLAPHGAWRI